MTLLFNHFQNNKQSLTMISKIYKECLPCVHPLHEALAGIFYQFGGTLLSCQAKQKRNQIEYAHGALYHFMDL